MKSNRPSRPAAGHHPGPARPPGLIAGLDIGATSVRMEIAEFTRPQDLQILASLVHPVNLGIDTFQRGHIRNSTLQALCQVLSNFHREMETYQVRDYRAIATSALREASNRDLAIDRIAHETGLKIEVLDAVEVSRILFQVLQPVLRDWPGEANKHTLILDLGGGTTETMLVRGSRLIFASTRRMGTQRLFDAAVRESGQGNERMMETAIRNLVSSIAGNYRSFAIGRCLLINRVLFKALDGLDGTHRTPAGLEFEPPLIERLTGLAGSMTLDELAEEFGLQASESELFWPALKMTRAFVEETGARRLLVAEVDTLAGILNELASELCGKNPKLAFRSQIIRSAMGLGNKFRFDSRHARQTARLSERLFALLGGYLGLDADDGLLLNVAAILHEIGQFVSEAAHHKHSEYLIEWAEIAGLNSRERTLVSQIARYHRRAHPQSIHPVFASLPPSDRIRVTKLAAILRLADALDRSHTGLIRDIRPRLEEDRLLIGCFCDEEPVVEISAMKEKSSLFTEITGLPVEIYRLAEGS